MYINQPAFVECQLTILMYNVILQDSGDPFLIAAIRIES